MKFWDYFDISSFPKVLCLKFFSNLHVPVKGTVKGTFAQTSQKSQNFMNMIVVEDALFLACEKY